MNPVIIFKKEQRWLTLLALLTLVALFAATPTVHAQTFYRDAIRKEHEKSWPTLSGSNLPNLVSLVYFGKPGGKSVPYGDDRKG